VAFQHNNINSAALHQELLQKNVICALRAGAIRFSPHFYTTLTQLDQAIERLLDVINSSSSRNQ
jgi:selenocysteine lyase/cysteine desulfurase